MKNGGEDDHQQFYAGGDEAAPVEIVAAGLKRRDGGINEVDVGEVGGVKARLLPECADRFSLVFCGRSRTGKRRVGRT